MRQLSFRETRIASQSRRAAAAEAQFAVLHTRGRCPVSLDVLARPRPAGRTETLTGQPSPTTTWDRRDRDRNQHRRGGRHARSELPAEAALPSQPRRQLRHPGRPRADARALRQPAPRDGLPAPARREPEAQARRGAARALEDREHLDRHAQEPARDAALVGREGRQGERRRPRQRRLRDRAAPVRHQPGQGQGPRPGEAGPRCARPTWRWRCACRRPSGCGGRSR